MSRRSERNSPAEPKGDQGIRCAIYTRKSTDEGLDQDFNSLDAQRESAEAFIESQKLEGWTVLPDRYDDGGFSGGNMERPALKKLLSVVDAGEVDCIVVYKVDRLSRSLLDFARIMEILDNRNVSFVSVTQQFSTTNSMGRLTLNILLSFAQFEREIIAERTRDKMSAARRKGKWVGGNPILGYDIDPQGGRINVNETEAHRVREIFDLYKERPSLIATVQELNNRGWGTKRWVTKKGRKRGGNPFNKHNLRYFLSNISYIGKVRYKGEVFEGEHSAIVEEEAFRNVQDLLKRNGGGYFRRANRYNSLLKGILRCASCDKAMIHTMTSRRLGVRYRYYVCSRAMKQGRSACPTKSLPANEIERFVLNCLKRLRSDEAISSAALKEATLQHGKTVDKLESERRELRTHIEGYQAEEGTLVRSMIKDSRGRSNHTNRLADLQDRIRKTEREITRLNGKIDEIENAKINEKHFSTALSIFDDRWEDFPPRERARVMQFLVARMSYHFVGKKLTITFRSQGIIALAQEIECGGRRKKIKSIDKSYRDIAVNFSVDFEVYIGNGKKGRKVLREGVAPTVETGKIPRVSRLMALAIHVDGLVRRGEYKDFSEVAHVGRVSRARMSQIINLLNIASDVQEELLFLPKVFRGRDPITERHLRSIAKEGDWTRQRDLWEVLKSTMSQERDE